MNLRVLGKFGFLLVIIGILIGHNGLPGFSAARLLISLLWWATFVTAIIGFVTGILLMMNKKTKMPVATEWLILLICVICGALAVFFIGRTPIRGLGTSGILMLVGWIVAVIGQLFSKSK